MKIQGELFAKIQTALIDTLKAHGLHPFMVNNDRRAWECFHKAASEGRININEIYRDHNDAHIQTALRRIFKQ